MYVNFEHNKVDQHLLLARLFVKVPRSGDSEGAFLVIESSCQFRGSSNIIDASMGKGVLLKPSYGGAGIGQIVM